MKEQETKKSKRKIALYYLILAACLLVIAAVTVTVVLTTKKPNNQLNTPPNQTVDKDPNKDNDNSDSDKKPSDDNNGGNTGDNDDNNPKPTENNGSYAMPTTQASVAQSYEFVYDKTLDRYCVHKGMDFEGNAGDKVYAVLDGTIKEVVIGSVLDGNYITIEHTGGVTSTYKFIDVKKGLEQGAKVKRGEEIGTIAAASGTEMNQGDHLHFEMTENGKIADPSKYLKLTEK